MRSVKNYKRTTSFVVFQCADCRTWWNHDRYVHRRRVICPKCYLKRKEVSMKTLRPLPPFTPGIYRHFKESNFDEEWSRPYTEWTCERYNLIRPLESELITLYDLQRKFYHMLNRS